LTNRCPEEVKQVPGTEPGTLSTKLNWLSEIAKQNPTLKFTSLAHLLDAECLLQAYKELNPQATAGIDKVTYKEYGKNLRQNIQELIQRLKDKKYKAADTNRIFWIAPMDSGTNAVHMMP
jgi:hypothetical protein